MGERLKVIVLFGGRSGEHDVSLESARSVMAALDPSRYEVVPVGITRQGHWLVGDGVWEAFKREQFEALQTATLLPDPTLRGLWRIEPGATTARMALLARADVVFPVLHGTFGEDGTLQGLLEMADVAYVGCGVLASALAMDKIAFKAVCRAHGIPVVDFVAISRRRWERVPDEVIEEIEAHLPYPLFVKPANLGSSVGISKCYDREALLAGLREAARYDRRLLVEAAVPQAREIEVSVLGNESPSASVPGEIIPNREFYDYEAKYLADGEEASKLLIPAPLPEAMVARVREMALAAYRAIDGAGLARVDFLLSRETGELYLNEMNTMPGFTRISMYPKLWEASGLPYRRLLSWLIDLALDRHYENGRSERIFRAPIG